MKINFRQIELNIFVLYVVSIGILILPSFLPGPVILGNIFALITLSLRPKYLKLKIHIPKKSKYFIYIIIYLCFYLLFSVFGSLSLLADWNVRGVFSIINRTVLIFLFSMVLMSLTLVEIEKVIKAYIVFVFIMSFCGFAAWILLQFDFVQMGEFAFSLFRATGGKMTRDMDFENGGYEAPFYLGLILTKSSHYVFLDFSYWRASGWAHEPTTATLFVTPALIILALNKKLFSKAWRIIFFFTTAVFWLVCSAVGSIIAVLGLIVIRAIFRFLRTGLTVKRIIVIIIILAAGVVFYDVIYEKIIFSHLIQEKFSSRSVSLKLAIENFFWFLYPFSIYTMLKKIILYLFILFIVTQSFKGIWKGGTVAVYGYTCLYFILHGLKGSWYHVNSYLLLFFFFYILLIYRQKAIS
jgi:hypothetical protein